MKISRRRFSQFMGALVLAPLAKMAEAEPVKADDHLLTKLSLDQMEELPPSAPGMFPVISTDAASDGPLYVQMGYWK